MIPFLAVDWGTTNVRAWRVAADGRVEDETLLPLGVSRLKPGDAPRVFEERVRGVIDAVGWPVLMCGMIGSTLGWTVAPYVDCPAGLSDLVGALAEVAPGVRIVPGVRCDGPFGASDVMRGEETQILGWAAESALEGRRLVCHPGTHPKWAVVENGRLVRFVTAMSGELFEVLRKHSVLATDASPDDEAAFDLGVAAAGDGSALAARLFSVRTRVVADGADAATSAAYLSGLLIGGEVAALPPLVEAENGSVTLIGDSRLCRWYGRALGSRGVETSTVDGEAAVLMGLKALVQAGALA